MHKDLKEKLLEKLIDDLHLAPSSLAEAGEDMDSDAPESDEEKKKKGLLSIVIAQGEKKDDEEEEEEE